LVKRLGVVVKPEKLYAWKELKGPTLAEQVGCATETG
jgi:hypothetical protein